MNAGTNESVRLLPTAVVVMLTAVVAFCVNLVAATGGHCDDDGCSAGFPEWLYVASGTVVLFCLFVLVMIAAAGIVGRLRG